MGRDAAESVRDEMLRRALVDPMVRARYDNLVGTVAMASGCLPWLGAVGGNGHGRFWIGRDPDGRDIVTCAHRYGYGMTHGYDALRAAVVVRHSCDEPICQTPAHWIPGSVADNSHDWLTRRDTIGSPLRDMRGAGGRSRALRDAARAGADLDAVALAGIPETDRYQDPLFDLG